MAILRIADVIQPEIFNGYVIQRTMEKSALINSGIVQNDPMFDELASGPNTLINMPYWSDLTGDSEIMNDSGSLTPDKIGTNKDVARKHGRAKAWGANGLSGYLSGTDPMAVIGNLVSDYWTRDMQKVLINTLAGIFASSSMSGKVLNISAGTGGAELITGESFIDANQLMGDSKDLLTGVMMHSAVEAYLAKRQLIDYVQEVNQSTRIPYFMNKRVIVDDSMPYNTSTKVGVAYLFGQNAIALGNGSDPNIIQTEIDRDSLASSGEDFLINRKIFIMHPRGIKWTEDSVAGTFPTNAEIATGTNWSLVYDPKAVRIVKFQFKIA
jgi:hypothetical protein